MALAKMPSVIPNTNSTMRKAIKGNPSGKELQMKHAGGQHQHHDHPDAAGHHAGDHQPGDVLGDRQRRGEQIQEIARPDVLEKCRADPCMMRVQKSHSSTPPNSVGTKSMPPPLTLLR